MNISERPIVLSLNGNWQAIGVRNVRQAFVGMNGGDKDNPPVKALDISYPLKENGEYDFNASPSIIPVNWSEWVELPIREYDLVINTSKHKIRVPTVIVSVNFKKIPKKRFRPSAKVLHELQKGICGYSGQRITLKEGSLEHKIPKSHGGKDTFENLMYVKKEINSLRGNKPLEEVGLKPLFHHKEPAPIPVNFTIKNHSSMDWRWFIGD